MIKKIIIIVLVGLLVIILFFVGRKLLGREPTITEVITEGDIIFQTSKSAQSNAIQLATHSQYSHCGIIFKDGNSVYVFEGVQPVKKTPLYEFIAKGYNYHYVVKRLKNADLILSSPMIAKMKELCEFFKGKNYDVAFEWTDDKIYCSELVWKIYKRSTGIEVGKLQRLKDFDLTSEVVKQEMIERYGDSIPMDEIVISPVSMFNSELLKTVISY